MHLDFSNLMLESCINLGWQIKKEIQQILEQQNP